MKNDEASKWSWLQRAHSGLVGQMLWHKFWRRGVWKCFWGLSCAPARSPAFFSKIRSYVGLRRGNREPEWPTALSRRGGGGGGAALFPSEAISSFLIQQSPKRKVKSASSISRPRSVRSGCYRVSQMPVHLGWVDLDFSCSTVCPILPGLKRILQNWLGSWARGWSSQIKVNSTQTPCR